MYKLVIPDVFISVSLLLKVRILELDSPKLQKISLMMNTFSEKLESFKFLIRS